MRSFLGMREIIKSITLLNNACGYDDDVFCLGLNVVFGLLFGLVFVFVFFLRITKRIEGRASFGKR